MQGGKLRKYGGVHNSVSFDNIKEAECFVISPKIIPKWAIILAIPIYTIQKLLPVTLLLMFVFGGVAFLLSHLV
jgi:hypothetical protein